MVILVPIRHGINVMINYGFYTMVNYGIFYKGGSSIVCFAQFLVREVPVSANFNCYIMKIFVSCQTSNNVSRPPKLGSGWLGYGMQHLKNLYSKTS